MLQTSKLTPVPKSRMPAEQWDKNMYRGISVSSIFARVVDRLMHTRLDQFIEARALRAPTQCGFRKGHGTLDALFTLQHCIKRSRWHKKRMYVVFVDFKKAFDTVRRDLMIDRCKQLGVHGQFLTSLLLLYDKVTQKVVVNGVVGDAFDTHVGTKQGSELSPLLFGVFIDMLHELIRLQVPGAGPILGSIQVPDLIYADDVILIALDDPTQAQQLLDCLDLFCAIFGMEVNTDPRKTCAMVFRDPHAAVPSVVLKFRGEVVPFKDMYGYLGLVVHATKGLLGAMDALAASGQRAMQTLQSRCRQQRLTQFDIKCRLFDALVEPVLSYGAHVWGPDVFGCNKFRTKPCDNSADKVHLAFLRHMVGCGKSTSIDVLLRDMNRLPLSYRWVVLACRWFMKLRDMDADRLAYNVWVADIELMLDGCPQCWTYKLLHTLTRLEVVPGALWDRRSNAGVTKEGVMGICIQEDVVKAALHKCFAVRWQGLHHNPRSAPSLEHDKCIHACWVMPPVAVTAGVVARSAQPRHMKLCMSFKMLQCLARFRVGWHYLESHSARLKRRHSGTPIVPWGDRKCRLCSVPTGPYYDGQPGGVGGGGGNVVEDLRHFLLECPAYCHIRAKYPSLFCGAESSLHDNPSERTMLAIFGCHKQAELAACLYSMNHHRVECLQPRPPGTHGGAAGHVLPEAEDDVEMVRLGMMD
jgi:Reverse transcriptase (RNA-dependent DNA polymerase)